MSIKEQWGKIKFKHKIQIWITLITFGTLIAYIIVSLTQFYQNRVSSREDLRAYISVIEITPIHFAPDSLFIYSINFINTGKTPGCNIAWDGQVKIDTRKVSEDDIIFITSKKPTNIPNIGTNQTRPIIGHSNYPISRQQYDSIRSFKPNLFIYVIGRITYDDIFKEKHFVMYCATLNVANQTFVAFTKKYNDSD
jgi:amino acid transporter